MPTVRHMIALLAAASAMLAVGPLAGASGSPSAPDLAITPHGPSAAGVDAPFTEEAVVTNKGSAPASGVTVSVNTGGLSIGPVPTSGMYCVYILRGAQWPRRRRYGRRRELLGDPCGRARPREERESSDDDDRVTAGVARPGVHRHSVPDGAAVGRGVALGHDPGVGHLPGCRGRAP